MFVFIKNLTHTTTNQNKQFLVYSRPKVRQSEETASGQIRTMLASFLGCLPPIKFATSQSSWDDILLPLQRRLRFKYFGGKERM